jgi:3-oxoacyl-[acyl-carrier-protein] synthase III
MYKCILNWLVWVLAIFQGRSMMKLKALGLLLLLISMIQSVAANELYRWQDEKGQWHFGDSASASLKSDVEVVHTAPETANFIKTKISKSVSKKAAKTAKNRSQTKRVAAHSKADKQQQCDKLRDSLRFKAFHYEERDYYDHECINKVKW